MFITVPAALDADLAEEGDEGALGGRVGVEGQQQREQEQRADVEQRRDTGDDGADRPRHDLLRFGRLTGRGSHQFDRGVGEHHAGGDQNQRQDADREETPAVGDHREAGRVAVDVVAATRKTVPTTRKASSATTLTRAAQNSNSPNSATETMFMPNTRASAISAISHCGISSNADQNLKYTAMAVESTIVVIAQLRKYIQAGHVGGFLAEELPGVGDERTRGGPVQDEFAHRAQDEEDEHPAHPVDDEQPGVKAGRRLARAEEQPGADGAADGASPAAAAA